MRVGRFLLYSTLGSLASVSAGTYGYFYFNHRRGLVPNEARYNVSKFSVSRDEMLRKLKSETFDILVIGGGATGSGVALDAGTRGLKCCVIEKGDFGSGTSSRSTKLLHGGIRYLEKAFKKLDVASFLMVSEALEERTHAIKCAPFMTRVLPTLMPVYNSWMLPYYWLGLKTYDFLCNLVCSFDSGVPGSFLINNKTAKNLFPLVNEEGLKTSLIYYDGQHNDARMNLNILLSSVIDGYIDGQLGATVANYVELVDFIKDGNGQIVGGKVIDKINNETFDISAKVVMNCTGPFLDTVRKISEEKYEKCILTSSGTHLALPKWYSQKHHGLIVNETVDDRVLFFLPWENISVAGTTDNACKLDSSPCASKEDVEFIVTNLSPYLCVSKETLRNDILATWNGIRPLLCNTSNNASDNMAVSEITRSHIPFADKSGLISIAGGKWTTYRKMAEEALDKALNYHQDKIAAKQTCRTKNMLLLGSTDHTNTYEMKEAMYGSGMLPLKLAKKYPELTQNQAEHLVRNYGFRSLEVCQLGSEEGLLKPLVHDLPFLKAEVIYGIRNEMACFPSDIIGRRMSLAYSDNEKAKAALPEVVDLMAKELNWSPEKIAIARDEGDAFLATTRTTNLP